MKYVITWHEREADSEEYEDAQKRLLGVFKDFKLPKGWKIHHCLLRVGEFGGYMIFETETTEVETDTLGRILDPVLERLDNHLRSDFQFKVDPVLDVTGTVTAMTA